GQLLRYQDPHADQVVAAASAPQPRHALAAQPQHGAALRAGRQLQLLVAVERRHVDLVAERGLGDVDGQLVDDVGVLPLEVRVRRDRNHDVEIARRAAAAAELALARQVDLLAVVDAGRYRHGDLPHRLDGAARAALPARLGDHLAASAAAIANRDVDELAEDGLLDAPHLAGAVALRAARRRRARLGAAAAAAHAGHRARHLEVAGHAEDRLLERQLEVVAQVGAAAGAARRAGPAHAAEEGLEDLVDAEAGPARAERA